MLTITKPRVLSVFSLIMINVIAVDSLRSLPFSAEYGLSLVFFYILAGLVFFVPIALVAAELATGWPKTGGMYIWVREAFGERWGFVTIWLQWIYNVVWYPSILAFLTTTATYMFNPHFSENHLAIFLIVMAVFWVATLANCFGMRLSSWISTFGAIVGTLLPMLFMIILAIMWLWQGHPSHVQFSWGGLLPKLSSGNSAFLLVVLFGLIGMEMSAVHAEEVKNPQHDYPRALTWSTFIILGSLILSSLAIAIVIPPDQISLVAGVIEAFSLFFTAFHMNWMIPIITVCIIIGGLSGVTAWVIGPTKGLLAAAQDGCLPKGLEKTNKHGAPINLLIFQGVIFSILCSAFLLFPTVNASYWFFSALTAQLAMMVYLFMFAAGVRLRYSHPEQVRHYTIPGKKWGIWLCAIAGISSSLFAIVLGFLPPAGVDIGHIMRYEILLVLGIVVFTLMPFILFKCRGKKTL